MHVRLGKSRLESQSRQADVSPQIYDAARWLLRHLGVNVRTLGEYLVHKKNVASPHAKGSPQRTNLNRYLIHSSISGFGLQPFQAHQHRSEETFRP